MKWQIAPEHRQEYWKKQQRKGNQSSAPSSPATKEAPSTRGENGQDAGPSYEHVFSSATTANKTSPAPSPGFSSFSVAPVEAYTPERGPRANRPEHDHPRSNAGLEDHSPLPTRLRINVLGRPYGLSDNVQNSPPVLSSSYYDDGPSSMITPAPQRQQPRLPPPSTAQVPSKFMPMSSPAQFWKFADIGSTPARPVPDMSPLKRNPGDNIMPSSSPPPPNLGSPSKAGTSGSRTFGPVQREVSDDSMGGDHMGRNGVNKPVNHASEVEDNEDDEDEDEDEEGGFDLARLVTAYVCFLSIDS
jgi:forkhead protein FKH